MTLKRQTFSTYSVAESKMSYTFALNNTSHASHLNSAPGLVFDFYRVELNLLAQ